MDNMKIGFINITTKSKTVQIIKFHIKKYI